jgi:hypothetical protein
MRKIHYAIDLEDMNLSPWQDEREVLLGECSYEVEDDNDDGYEL